MEQLLMLLSCYLGCSGLLSVGSFLTFKFLSLSMRPNLATHLYSHFLSALCDTVMDSSHRAYLCLFLPPSLPSDLIRGQWAGKEQQGGERRGFRPTVGGSKVSLQQAGAHVGATMTVSSSAHKAGHRGNSGTIIGCTSSCAQRIGANEVLTRASTNDQVC